MVFDGFVKGALAGVKKKISAMDLDKDGVADVAEIKIAAEAVEKDLLPLAEKLTQEHLVALIASVNKNELGDLYTDAEIQTIAASLPQLAIVLKHAEAIGVEVAEHGV